MSSESQMVPELATIKLSEKEMVSELFLRQTREGDYSLTWNELDEVRPVMPADLFRAAIKGNSIVLIRHLGLLPEEQTKIQVTEEASHCAPEEISTENQTVQSDLQSATRFGDTILHLLITEGHNELALMVFQIDMSLLKAQNNMLETPLYCAAKVGNKEVVNNLIQSNDVVVKDSLAETNKIGDTALHVSAKHGYRDICHLLMKLDAKLAYKVNNKMEYPLYMAITEGHTEMVQTMLEVDPTLACTPFSDGMFPVHEAARMGNLDLVMHFMENYPNDAELRDAHGRNLFHIAAKENGEEIFSYVFNIVTKNEKKIIPGVFKDRKMIERMITAMNYEGDTPFHIAAMEGHMTIMRDIWEFYKAAERVPNKHGQTPLELSATQVVKTNKDIDNGMVDKYLEKNERYKFTPKWFDDVMEPPLENKWDRTQVIGLGSVLITTVTFAAAFTIPGGYDQDQGTPVLGRRYMFRAFILANALAFIQGFLSLFVLLMETLRGLSDSALVFATISFLLAASSMVVAFGLGMYVTLAPVCLPIAILLLVITILLGTPAGIAGVQYGKYKLGPTMNSSNMRTGISILFLFYVMSFLFIFCLALV